MPLHPPIAPEVVTQHILDCTEQALMQGDFDQFAPWFMFPYLVICGGGQTCCETADDLRALFDTAHAHYTNLGVKSLFRFVLEAKVVSPGHIQAAYETRQIGRGALQISDTYVTLVDVRETAQGWKVQRGEYGLPPNDARNAVLLGQGKA